MGVILRVLHLHQGSRRGSIPGNPVQGLAVYCLLVYIFYSTHDFEHSKGMLNVGLMLHVHQGHM